MSVLATETTFGAGTIKIMLEIANGTFKTKRNPRYQDLSKEDYLIEKAIKEAEERGETMSVLQAMDYLEIPIQPIFREMMEQEELEKQMKEVIE